LRAETRTSSTSSATSSASRSAVYSSSTTIARSRADACSAIRKQI
jgi:hypothetical protein